MLQQTVLPSATTRGSAGHQQHDTVARAPRPDRTRPSDTASFSPSEDRCRPAKIPSSWPQSCWVFPARRPPIEGASHGGGRKEDDNQTSCTAHCQILPTLLSRSMSSKSLAHLLFFQHQPGSDLRLRCFCLSTHALMNQSVR